MAMRLRAAKLRHLWMRQFYPSAAEPPAGCRQEDIILPGDAVKLVGLQNVVPW